LKRRKYAEVGLLHCWLVDPEAACLAALELDTGSYRDAVRICATDQSQPARLDLDHAGPVSIDVANLFGLP
jgi:hypothetical protein